MQFEIGVAEEMGELVIPVWIGLAPLAQRPPDWLQGLSSIDARGRAMESVAADVARAIPPREPCDDSLLALTRAEVPRILEAPSASSAVGRPVIYLSIKERSSRLLSRALLETFACRSRRRGRMSAVGRQVDGVFPILSRR